MSIRFRCPSCKRVINAPEKASGRSARCPGCRRAVVVPSEPATIPEDKGDNPPKQEAAATSQRSNARPHHPAGQTRPVESPKPPSVREPEKTPRPRSRHAGKRVLVGLSAAASVILLVLLAVLGRILLFSDGEPVAADGAAKTANDDSGQRPPNGQVARLIKRLENAEDSQERWAAAEQLGDLGSDASAAVPALMARLKDGDTAVRLEALKALGRIGPDADDAVPALIELADRDDSQCKEPAIRVLGEIGPKAEDAVPVLLRMAEDERMPLGLRCSAATSLGSIGKNAEEVVPAIAGVLDLLLQDRVEGFSPGSHGPPLEVVQRPVISALGKMGPPAVPALQEAYERGAPSGSVAQALGGCGPEAIPALLQIKDFFDRNVSVAAIKALGRIGKPAVPSLIEILERETGDYYGDVATRSEAAYALRQIGPSARAAIPALERAAQTRDLEIQQSAKSALERIRDSRGAEAGVSTSTGASANLTPPRPPNPSAGSMAEGQHERVTASERPTLDQSARQGSQQLPQASRTPSILPPTEDPGGHPAPRPKIPEHLRAKVEVFGRVPPAELEQVGQKALANPSAELVSALLAWYEWFNASYDADPDPFRWRSRRQGAAFIEEAGWASGSRADSAAMAVTHSMKRALQGFRDPATVPAFIEAVDSKRDANVRLIAISVLGEIKDPRAVPPLIDLLESEDGHQLRNSAATALAKIDDQRAVAALMELPENVRPMIGAVAERTSRQRRATGQQFDALCRAAMEGNEGKVRELIQEGVDVNGRGEYYFRRSPLGLAVQTKQSEIIPILLAAGAEPNGSNGEESTVFGAVHSGERQVVRMLLDAGADPDGCLASGTCALEAAVGCGDVEMVDMLLKTGAAVDGPGAKGSPLHAAVRHDDAAILTRLLEAKADVNIRGTYGWTPLHAAINKGNIRLIPLLLRGAADPNTPSEKGNTPLHLAAQMEEKAAAEIVTLLLDADADVNAKNKEGQTPLHRVEQLPVAKLLTERGADVNIQDGEGATALNRATNTAVRDFIRLQGGFPGRPTDPQRRIQLSEADKQELQQLATECFDALKKQDADTLWRLSAARLFVRDATRRGRNVDKFKARTLNYWMTSQRLINYDETSGFFTADPPDPDSGLQVATITVIAVTAPTSDRGLVAPAVATTVKPWYTLTFVRIDGQWSVSSLYSSGGDGPPLRKYVE